MSRRPYARCNRGRVRRVRGAAGGGVAAPTTPVLPANALTYIDASDLVGDAADPVTAWASRTDALAGGGPYDWAATAPGIIDDTTLSGGRRSVLFNGTTQYMLAAAGLETELSGSDVPFTRYLHGYLVSITSNDCVMSASNDGFTHIDIFRERVANWRVQRTGGLVNTPAFTQTVGEFKIVDIQVGATRTTWVNDVEYDLGALDSVALTFTKIALAALVGSSAAAHANIAVRRHGYWDVAFDDAQALALPGVGE